MVGAGTGSVTVGAGLLTEALLAGALLAGTLLTGGGTEGGLTGTTTVGVGVRDGVGVGVGVGVGCVADADGVPLDIFFVGVGTTVGFFVGLAPTTGADALPEREALAGTLETAVSRGSVKMLETVTSVGRSDGSGLADVDGDFVGVTASFTVSRAGAG